MSLPYGSHELELGPLDVSTGHTSVHGERIRVEVGPRRSAARLLLPVDRDGNGLGAAGDNFLIAGLLVGGVLAAPLLGVGMAGLDDGGSGLVQTACEIGLAAAGVSGSLLLTGIILRIAHRPDTSQPGRVARWTPGIAF